uniref:Putative tick salivary peptide group 1 n=1 Tax=Ixodes ricinus TaxID=34613 RepID=V5H473_IXORI
MGLTGTTLVLVSLAFFGSAAAHNRRNGTRPESEQNREGCVLLLTGTLTLITWDQILLQKTVKHAFNNDRWSGNIVKTGSMSFD